MPNIKSMPSSLQGVFKKLWRYSVSHNIYLSLVKPLVVDIYGDTPTYKDVDNILELLTAIHKCFWHERGTPQVFQGAVAGHFQELVFAFKQAEKRDGRIVRVGAEGRAGEPKVGGDVSQIISEGNTKTYQFKVSVGSREFIKEHINKAGAQLTGQTGEAPAIGSKKIIYMIVQNTEAFEAYDAGQWKALIEEALSLDYVSDRGGAGRPPRVVRKEDIKANVDKIKILTRNTRYRFENNAGIIQFTREEALAMEQARFFTFSDGRFDRHWKWLKDTWWQENVEVLPNKNTIVTQTKLNGANAASTFQGLPYQPLPI